MSQESPQQSDRSDQGENGHPDEVPIDATAPSQAFREALSQLGELKEYAAQYVAARTDLLKASVRHGIAWAIVGVLALIAGAGILVTATVLLLAGLAQAIAVLLGDRIWAGNLIVGAAVLAAIGLTTWIAVRHSFNSSRSRMVMRYERRLRQQRIRYGHNAAQRVAEQRRERRQEHQSA